MKWGLLTSSDLIKKSLTDIPSPWVRLTTKNSHHKGHRLNSRVDLSLRQGVSQVFYTMIKYLCSPPPTPWHLPASARKIWLADFSEHGHFSAEAVLCRGVLLEAKEGVQCVQRAPPTVRKSPFEGTPRGPSSDHFPDTLAQIQTVLVHTEPVVLSTGYLETGSLS